MNWILSKIMGTRNQRQVKKTKKFIEEINRIEEQLQSLSEEAIKNKTIEFKERLAKGESLDDLRNEAFAVVKNVCRRLSGQTWNVCGYDLTWEMIPFDVQLIGAIALHQGKIVEMATGEGKTLVATMPLYLNALAGKGAHIVTVNDYLAKRDSEWMGQVFKYLGLTVGCLENQMPPSERKKAYNCDITYGTNSEFGFDYLRDNSSAGSLEEQVQRDHYYAIIDEVDSILIDEARTPLIISGPVPSSTHKYAKLRPKVVELFKSQTMLCNQLIQNVKEELNKKEEIDYELLGRNLLLAHKGTPKNKQLLKLQEDPKIRKLIEKTELEYGSDFRRDDYQALKEELFFIIEERNNVIELSEKGRSSISSEPDEFVIPDLISLYQEVDSDETLSDGKKEQKKIFIQKKFEESSEKIHNLNQLLKAYSLFEKDVDYVIQENKVMIVDEFTGRIMHGRRFSDGLHQALEAKENVKIEDETQTFATITIQNYFRMYEKLAGMTGTAETEANEFHQIYNLDVMVIPTNEPIRRIDYNDVIHKTKREKYNAIVEEIERFHQQGRPVLVGTITVDTSEVLSRLLKRKKIPHSVLNAKYHQQEAEIIRQAGQKNSVTIATNMAGRGTDIKLGEGIVECEKCCLKCSDDCKTCAHENKKTACTKEVPCGLHVIGTERHESRRIDRQLRGRSGRQGDPGSSRFFISLEDDLMRLFGSERIASIMEKIGLEEGQDLTHPLLTRSIETAQKRVEERNFSIRKHTLQYDDVMNKQRQILYNYRKNIIETENLKEFILETAEETIENKLAELSAESSADLNNDFINWFNDAFPFPKIEEIEFKNETSLAEFGLNKIKEYYALKEKYEGKEGVRRLEKIVSLNIIDKLWKDHLYNMDQLKESVFLRAYGQIDPLLAYKKEGFFMFSEMMDNIKKDIVLDIFKHSIITEDRASFFNNIPQEYHHSIMNAFNVEDEEKRLKERQLAMQTNNGETEPKKGVTYIREDKKIGRNDLCPCGSGKKYKKCCGS